MNPVPVGMGHCQRLTVQRRRGSIALSARADDGIQPGTVFMPFCYAEAAANLLTNQALDPFAKIAEVKYCAVKISCGDASCDKA